MVGVQDHKMVIIPGLDRGDFGNQRLWWQNRIIVPVLITVELGSSRRFQAMLLIANLWSLATVDQIEGGNTWPNFHLIDPARVGIWGLVYGGIICPHWFLM